MNGVAGFTMQICRLVYISERNLAAALDVDQIIRASRQNNSRCGVTGFLMFDGQYLIQCLEGDRLSVTQTYNRVASDGRHSNIHLVSCADAKERLFPEWSMGLLNGIAPALRERLLAQHTITGMNPKTVAIERLLYILQMLAAESQSLGVRRMAAE